MTKTLYKYLILFSFLVSATSYAVFFEERAEGWHWYRDLPIVDETKEPNKIASQPQTPTEILKAYQQELEKRLHLAWVAPTPRNIKSYQEMQRDLMQRSEHFAKTWMQVVYKNPELDHTLVSPVNQKARHIYLDQEKNRTFDAIGNLKEEYGLFFFFSSQCRYCHEMAPIVQEFSRKYGWETIAISADGGVLSGFKETLPDNGLLAKWNVTVLPALFAINPKTEQILPIAYGLTALDQLEWRIMALIEGQ